MVEDLRRTFEAATVSVTGYHWAAMQGFVINAGTDPEMIENYVRHYAKLDPVTPRLMAIPVGQLINSNVLFSATEAMRTKYYADWPRPQNLLGGLVGTTIRSDEMTGRFVIAREINQRDFDRSELTALGMLTPHLGRAVRTFYHLAAARAQNVSTLELINRLPPPALLIDREAKLLHCNAAAEKLLAKRDGLSTQAGRLREG